MKTATETLTVTREDNGSSVTVKLPELARSELPHNVWKRRDLITKAVKSLGLEGIPCAFQKLGFGSPVNVYASGGILAGRVFLS